MNLAQIIDQLELLVLTEPKNFNDIEPVAGYASDLLSCVMAGAIHGGLWVTLQAHGNIVAVAALLEQAAVIITEGAQPDPSTIAKANAEEITLLSTPKSTFEIVGQLWAMGIRSN
jgi:hypothetical protein